MALKVGSREDYDRQSYVEAPSNPTTPARQVVITNDSSSPIPVDITDATVSITATVPNTSHVQNTISVGAVAVKLTPSPLADRKFLLISNETGQDLFYGSAVVSTSLGARLQNRQTASLAIGPSIDIWAIKAGASGNVIVQEFA